MKILLIGCGKMGSAMLNGWLKSGVKAGDIAVVDPFAKLGKKIAVYKSLAKLSKTYVPDVIILAVKPQNLNEVLPELARFNKALVVSIIAGKTIAYIEKHLKSSVIIRTMPNLPAVIGKGVIGAVANKVLSAKNKALVVKLLKPCGKLVWFKDEKLINTVTAISGSGPAYVFLFAQGLVEAGVALGLDEKTAKLLALETIKGSVLLAENASESLEQLKINVTSKGGTTEAALKVLEQKNALKTLIKQAATQAKQRALELSE